jgi:hypothetical protein
VYRVQMKVRGARPIPDFNGDGKINCADVCLMVDQWQTDNPRYDIAPPPFGDGIVDVQDLVALAEQLFTDVRCIAQFKLDETEGTIAHDYSRDREAILLGNPQWQPGAGVLAGALQLDGIDDYLSTPFILDPAKGALSAFTWVKGGGPGQVIISQTDGSGYGDTWLGIDPSEGTLITKLMYFELASETVVTDSRWHCIGLVWNGLRRGLYVDGQEVASDASDLMAISATGGMCIGAGKNLEAGTFFSGLIDDIRIYNVPLSAEEIAALAE